MWKAFTLPSCTQGKSTAVRGSQAHTRISITDALLGPPPRASNTFPGGTGATGPGTTLGEAVLKRHAHCVAISSSFSKETKKPGFICKISQF